jgi:phosphate transport system substrate-binding protein
MVFLNSRKSSRKLQPGILWFTRVLAAILLVLIGPFSVLAGPLLLSGSSTVQKLIIEPAQQALEKKTGVMIDSTGPGTIHGVRALMKGEVAAALASCPLDVAFRETGIPTEGTYREHVIQQDTVVVIVNPGNKVKGLSPAQLAGILTGAITTWKDVGGSNDRIVVVTPPPSSGTRAFVKDAVMQGADFATNAYVTVTDREAIDIVAQSPISLGILSEGFVRMNKGKVKVVKTPPLKRQLSVITRDEPSPELKAVIAFLQSKEAKKLFR